MTSERRAPECIEMRRRLAEGELGPQLDEHVAGCRDCSAFAAALAEVDERVGRLPRAVPPDGAADRAIARFRAGIAGHAVSDAGPFAPPREPGASPDASRLTALSSPAADTAAGTQASRAWPVSAGQVPRRGWYRPASLAAGIAAAIALVVSLVTVLGPTSTPPAYAAELRVAAVNTGAQKSALLDLTGAASFSVRGRNVKAAVRGRGATESPDRGRLTLVTTLLGHPVRQDIVNVGNRIWTRLQGGQWALAPTPTARGGPIDQALAYPAQALDQLTHVGSRFHSLGTTTIDGTRVRGVQLTIPGDLFHAFGDLPERVSDWTVVVDVNQTNLVLDRLTIGGRGTGGALHVLAAAHPSRLRRQRQHRAATRCQDEVILRVAAASGWQPRRAGSAHQHRGEPGPAMLSVQTPTPPSAGTLLSKTRRRASRPARS